MRRGRSASRSRSPPRRPRARDDGAAPLRGAHASRSRSGSEDRLPRNADRRNDGSRDVVRPASSRRDGDNIGARGQRQTADRPSSRGRQSDEYVGSSRDRGASSSYETRERRGGEQERRDALSNSRSNPNGTQGEASGRDAGREDPSRGAASGLGSSGGAADEPRRGGTHASGNDRELPRSTRDEREQPRSCRDDRDPPRSDRWSREDSSRRFDAPAPDDDHRAPMRSRDDRQPGGDAARDRRGGGAEAGEAGARHPAAEGNLNRAPEGSSNRAPPGSRPSEPAATAPTAVAGRSTGPLAPQSSLAPQPQSFARRREPGPRGSGGPNSPPPSPSAAPAAAAAPAPPSEKPNFGLSGALAEDSRTGNLFRGVVLKWAEPADAGTPSVKWRLHVFKGEEQLEKPLYIFRQSAFLVGRDRKIADIPTDHPSCSSQHAVIQFRRVPVTSATGEGGLLEPSHTGVELSLFSPQATVVKPYIMDLESTNCTFLNGKKIEPARYIELRAKDVLRFGLSTREYVLLHDELAS